MCYSEHYVEVITQQLDSGIQLEWRCYSEHYVEGTAQRVDSNIAATTECVTVKIMWKLLHSRWTVV